jgi:hypothetical protein
MPGIGTPQTPDHADLSSVGADGDAQRALTGQYSFSTTNQNIPGGLLHTCAGPDYCFDAGSAAPLVGAQVLMRPCTVGSPQRKFAYTNTLSLNLTSPPGCCQQFPDCGGAR